MHSAPTWPSLRAQAAPRPRARGSVVGGSGRVVAGPPSRVAALGCRVAAPLRAVSFHASRLHPAVPRAYPAPPRAPVTHAQRPARLHLPAQRACAQRLPSAQPPVTIQLYCIAIQIVPSQSPLLQYNCQAIKLYCNTPSSQASHLSVTIQPLYYDTIKLPILLQSALLACNTIPTHCTHYLAIHPGCPAIQFYSPVQPLSHNTIPSLPIQFGQ